MRIAIVDDHPIVCQGIGSILANEKDLELVACVSSGKEAEHSLGNFAPDLVLVDLRDVYKRQLVALGLSGFFLGASGYPVARAALMSFAVAALAVYLPWFKLVSMATPVSYTHLRRWY